MKTYNDRTADVAARIRKGKRKRFAVATTCLSLALVIVAALLIAPFGAEQPRPEAAYDDLVAKLRPLMSEGAVNGSLALGGTTAAMNPTGATMNGDAVAESPNVDYTGSGADYVEVTDNQVDGVTEADIFKRTTEHIFYLQGKELSVFSIEGEASQLVSTYTITMTQTEAELEAMGEYRYGNVLEMYLSQDCSTITVMVHAAYVQGTYTVLISLDVTDPANVVEKGRSYVSGGYQSSRLVDGQILLMSGYRINWKTVDFDDPNTFVPQVITAGNVELVAPEDIICPETVRTCTYTTICLLDMQTLSVQDTAAYLSYSDDIYVSQDHIYVSRSYTELDNSTKSEISCISYSAGVLEHKGSVTVVGTIKDQYSMDEYNGILRVVTSTREWNGPNGGWIISASLYCVSLENFEIVASVENFSPRGEDVQSVRFDGDMAYVCTAERITITDPVFFFDLSDLNNITWTDTGTIDGYSTSLIQLLDGYLLGIGYGETRQQLKIEVYMEENGKVIPVCAYEEYANFSEEYKSYFIDRENNLVGLAVMGQDGVSAYVVLHFDGYQLNTVASIKMPTMYNYLKTFRADLIDGYLYVLGASYDYKNGQETLFAVEKIW